MQTEAKMSRRDVLLAAMIVVGFVVFQIGANWQEGPGVIAAILGLAVALGAVGTFIYDNVSKKRVDTETGSDVPEPAVARFLFHHTNAAPIWLAVRLYVGVSWLVAGLEKATGSPSWLSSGIPLRGFWTNAAKIPAAPGRAAITYDWYRTFIQFMLDNHWDTWFAKVICLGEILVGIGLICGGLVGIAAFFGVLMNMSFMLAGSASTNPVLFTLGILLIMAWQVAGYWGLDRFLLPLLGAPWKPGILIHRGQAPRLGASGTAGD